MMLQVLPGGHCMFCHKDYTEMGHSHRCHLLQIKYFKQGKVYKQPTACSDKCSKRYSLGRNTIEGKLDYIIQLLERPTPKPKRGSGRQE